MDQTSIVIEKVERAAFQSMNGHHKAAWDAIHSAFDHCDDFNLVQQEISARLPAFDDQVKQSLTISFLKWSTDPKTLHHALKALNNERDIANLHVTSRFLTVWAVSRESKSISLRLVDGNKRLTRRVRLVADHPYAPSQGFAAAVRFKWPDGFTGVEVSADCDLTWINRTALRPGYLPTSIPMPPRRQQPYNRRLVRVVIPIFNQPDIARRCLNSLFDDGDQSLRELIIINDASTDPRVNELLSWAKERGVVVLTNPDNLGFTDSVNRVLSEPNTNDLVLLNSDTLVSRHWLSRLQTVAHSDPTIGTVTPLSNNGQTVSFPKPFQANPLPSRVQIASISARLNRQNATKYIEIPSGLGFCLYIKSTCLEQTGVLDSRNFNRGYLEEVDFCLRAEAHGFKNVCALGVYVAHDTSRSFGIEKHYLLNENRKTLRKLYPRHARRLRSFIDSDPFLEYRSDWQAVEY